MIKNNKQAAITKSKLAELEKSLEEFEATQKDLLHPVRLKLYTNTQRALIKDLINQLEEYAELTTKAIVEFNGFKLVDLPKLLIKARLSKRMPQRELADILGIKEQQIQRYEFEDYSTASWSRILAVCRALDLDINLEKITVAKPKMIIPKVKIVSSYKLPPGMQRECVSAANQRIKEKRSMLYPA